MTFIAIAICVVGVSLSLAWAFTSYTKEAHRLSERRDVRAHELAKKETDAVAERMRIESKRTSENDVSIARLNYHTAQSHLAQRTVDRLAYHSDDGFRERISEAVIRQLDGDRPPNGLHPEHFSDEGKALT